MCRCFPVCDFMAINSNKKFDINQFLVEVVNRRKRLKTNEHGWGIFFDDGTRKVLVKEPMPAWLSPFFLWFEERRFNVEAYTFILHVRKVSVGTISWFNTHPFMRTMNGRTFVFAHKGTIKESDKVLKLKSMKPKGNTDSERFFLYLLENFLKDGSIKDYLDDIINLANCVAFENKLNFFLFDGEYLLVYDGKDDEPLYYQEEKGFFMATSEEFKNTKMGEIGQSVSFLVKNGRILKIIKE